MTDGATPSGAGAGARDTADAGTVADRVAAARTMDAILRDAARREIMPRFRRLDAGAVRIKSGPLDLVTEADEAAERVIEAALRAAFPDAVIVGEEAAAADATVLDRLDDAPLAIVVDPIDGTANYAAGLPLFGSMAALIRGGETIASAIHDPVCGDSVLAALGGGAWVERPDGERTALAVAAGAPVAQMSGKAAPRHFGEGRERLAVDLLSTLAALDYRCAAHEYRMAATGHCHFLLYSVTMPWDHAPGELLFREAGGVTGRLDGERYRPSQRSGGLLCAPDAASWRALRDRLFG